MGMQARRRSLRDEHGQATIAFVAVVPALVLIAGALLQLALAGHASLAAAAAARAAARADYVGANVERAARRALPPGLRDRVDVTLGDEAIAVEIEAPRALPVGPPIPVSASTRLGPAEGVPGG